MLKPDIVGSAFAISVFLIIYYVAVGFFPAYFQTIFGFSQSKANALGQLELDVQRAGAARRRRPLGPGARAQAVHGGRRDRRDHLHHPCSPLRATHPHTSYSTFVWLLIGISVSLGVAYAPWMASFTETVERRNPALTATGLAVWGLVIRIVIAVSVFFVPHRRRHGDHAGREGPGGPGSWRRSTRPQLATAAEARPHDVGGAGQEPDRPGDRHQGRQRGLAACRSPTSPRSPR